MAQGIGQLGQGIAGGIQQYGVNQEKEKNILTEARGRGRALRNTIKGLESLNILPAGMYDQVDEMEKNSSPKAFLAFVNQSSDNISGLITGGIQMKQIEAQKAKQQEIATANEAARLATQQSIRPDGTVDTSKAMQIYVAKGGRDNTILAETLRMVESEAGAKDTSTMRETNAIIANEIKAGKLTDDPVVVASRRAQLLAGGGRDAPEKFFNAGVFVERESGGNPVQTVRELASGRVGTVDDKGAFTSLDMARYKPTTASDANVFMQEADFKKLADSVVDQENSIKALNRYAKTAGGLPQGIEKLQTRISSAIKTSITQEPLTEEEVAMGISKARQERLLGALRTTILGPGVLTENDAARIINAVGGDINSVLTNPVIVQETIQELLDEKMNSYQQNLQIYNKGVVGRYSQAGYKQRAGVEAYKPEQKQDTQAGTQGETKVIGGVTYVKTANGWERK